jgi:hypothetical protein
MKFNPLPMDQAPIDTVCFVFLPWLFRPGDRRIKNNTGWYRAILCKHPRMKYHPRPYRWKVWFSASDVHFISASPKYWAKIDSSGLAISEIKSLAVH